MPFGESLVAMGIDLFDGAIWIDASDGRRASVPLTPHRCVAGIWTDFTVALDGLEIDADVWEKPQEIPDITPFSENAHDCTFDLAHAQRFYRLEGSSESQYMYGVGSKAWTLGMARFMFPNIVIEPPTKFKAGRPEDYEPGQVETRFTSRFGVWIVRVLDFRLLEQVMLDPVHSVPGPVVLGHQHRDPLSPDRFHHVRRIQGALENHRAGHDRWQIQCQKLPKNVTERNEI